MVAQTSTKVKLRRQKIVLEPFEDSVHYQTMVSFRFRGMEVGAYLLKKTPKSPFTLVFGFDCLGVHSFLSNEKLEKIFDLIESGLKDFPIRERITFHLGAYKSDRDRQEHLDRLISQAPSEELKFLLYGEKARIRQLSGEGQREPKTLRLFCTYQTNKGEQHQDWLDKALAFLEELWLKFSGKFQEAQNIQLRHILRRAWGDGFLHWKQILENKLELRVTPLGAQGLWDYMWGRLNNRSKPIDVPQQIIVGRNQFDEQIDNDLHGSTLLLADEEPTYKRQWVKIGGQYIGLLNFWSKPGGWADKRSQLHYLWELVARELVTDTEIITQIVPANQKRITWLVGRVTKQSTAKFRTRAQHNESDKASQLKARGGEEAQERLIMGEIPFYVATTILVRRSSLEDLEEACRYIESCFHRPAWVVRERQITWKQWLETLPIVDEPLLGNPFIGRRQLYLSSEVPGFLPIVKTHSRDTEGLELIGEDGGTPIFIDLFNTGNGKHRHIGVFGTTRSGKSVLVAGILTQGLAQNIPIVAIDYPKPDGSSTYTTYAEFMGERGGYFDVGKESVNLFDRPNLSALPPEKQTERFEDYKDFLVSCLLVMVTGESNDMLLNQTVRTFLYQTLNRFFADPKILARYMAAEAKGLGSPEWKQMPTLKDFLAYFYQLVEQGTFEKMSQKNNLVPFSGQTQSIVPKALEQIGVRLEYWTESRVGKAISKPSSVPTNAALMVLALRQISANEDAAILSLVAYAAALRRAMEFPISIFFIDESPILFKFPSIVRLVASIISNGAKSGVRVVLSAQDPNSIFNSEAGQQIFQNINTRIIGKIQPIAIESFVRILGYPSELISRCANFFPKAYGLYTQWLLDDNGTISFCRRYTPIVELGLVANNSDEQEVRAQFWNSIPDKYEAISQFSLCLAESIRGGKKLSVVAKSYLPTAKVA
jgi:hypothetical protein